MSENEPKRIHVTLLILQDIYQVLLLILCPKQPEGMEDPGYSPTSRFLNIPKVPFSSERKQCKNDTFLFCTSVLCAHSELESYLLPAETNFRPYCVFLLLVLQSMHNREQAGSPFLSTFLTIGKFCASLHTSPNTQSKNKVKGWCDWDRNFTTKTGSISNEMWCKKYNPAWELHILFYTEVENTVQKI